MMTQGASAPIKSTGNLLSGAVALPWHWGWLLVGVVLVTHVIWLTRMPPLFVDEAWQSNAIWSWLKTGRHFELMHAGTLDQFGMPWLRRVVIGGLPWLAMFAVFGVGFAQARMVSLLFGIALLGLVYGTVSRLYSRSAALLAVLLLSLSLPFTQAAHYARQDMMLALFAFGAFSLACVAMQRGDGRLHLLAGLVMGLSVDTHHYGLLLIPGLAGMYVARYGRRLLRERGAWLALAGGALGLAWFAAAHILPDPQAFARMNAFDAAGSRTPPLLTFDPRQWLRAVVDEARLYGFARSPLELVAFVFGTLALALRRSPSDKLVLGFMLSALLALTFISGKKSDLYAIFLYPFMLIAGAEGVVELYRRDVARGVLRVLAVGAAAGLLIFAGQRYVRAGMALADYDYMSLAAQVAAEVPPGSRVMGSPSWWFGFVGGDYVSVFNISYYNYYNGLDFETALYKDRPDYLIDDDLLRIIASPQRENDPEAFRGYRVPFPGLDGWLEANGKMVTTVHDPRHGDVRVYKLDWSKIPTPAGAKP
jgi:Dolichyl-phosphate-mannose-protein mannosyltransferase